jgi:type I restriction enzyme, S subunit
MKKDWKIKQLKEVCDFQNGFAFKSKTFRDNGIPVLRISNIQKDKIDLNKIVYINTSDYQEDLSKYIVGKHDLLIAMSGATTGKIGFNQTNTIFYLNQRVGKFKPKKDLFISYLYYYLSTKVEESLKISAGSAQPNLSTQQIKSFKIPIPPLNEQKRIVAKLDKCFEAIHIARANVEKNLQNAKDLFQSQLNQIFSHKGEGWVEKNLGSVCENFDSKRIPITKSKRVHGEIPYYGASGIVDYISEFIFDEDLLLVSEDGANLLARTYPIAFSVSGKIWVNNHAHVLKFEDINEQYFIEYFLNSIKLNDYVSGMAQPKLNQKKLNSILVPYPSVEVQRDTVDYLNKLYSQVKSLESNYQQELNALDELKKSILQKAFNGGL